MKLIMVLLILTTSAWANIPTGKYKVDKIQCKSGEQLKLGGKFMVYAIFLQVEPTEMIMTVTAKSGDWAPFRLDCTQTNRGSYTNTAENRYEGELPMVSAKCNAEAWTNILKRKQFGAEKYGEFTYKVAGNKLTIWNPNTFNKYKCDKPSDYPIYYYTKQ